MVGVADGSVCSVVCVVTDCFIDGKETVSFR
jgi:hypothetical protein